MKAQDLMIGDWVLCDGQPTPSNVVIQTVAQDGIWFEGDEFEGAASFDHIFPIPLTPEILEKNGFEDVGSEVYECDVLPFYIWWERDRHRLGIDIEDSTYDKENFAQMLRVPVSYVHDLQHALRLCGIEKEIVL